MPTNLQSDGPRRPVTIDPATGIKSFDTRAAKASEKIAGKGYSIVAEASLRALPEPPADAVFDEAEKARYRADKEARRGAADYVTMDGELRPLSERRVLGAAGRA
ncbi:MAG: hypothetical protein QM733_13730 [Ilumatobacteraceae bacterium]